jgi:Zinc-binding dehydrogenase
VLHLPGVGKNFQDHVGFGCVWESPQGLLPRNNMGEATFFWKSDPDLDTPDLHTCQGEVPFCSAETAAQFRRPAEIGNSAPMSPFNYSNGFLEAVRDVTGGRGMDMAFDAVGKTTFSDTVKALAPRGMAISYGPSSGLPSDVEVSPLILKGARVAGASLFVYISWRSGAFRKVRRSFPAPGSGRRRSSATMFAY